MHEFKFVLLFVLALLLSKPVAMELSAARIVSEQETQELQRDANASQSEDGDKVVFTIPVDSTGIQYSGEGLPGIQTWGPKAFAVASDGTFWVADTVGNRVLHYDTDGALLNLINLNDRGVIGIGDVEAVDSGFLVLDIAAQIPRVLQLASDGGHVAAYDLPEGLRLEDGLSGLAVGDHGEILVEQEGGAFLSQLADANGVSALVPLPGYIHRGILYKAQPADLSTADTTHGYIIAGSSRIEVTVPNMLAGLRVLGFNADGGFCVVVEEMVADPTVWVDQSVRCYGAAGELLGVARVPVAEQYTYVQNGLAVGPDGNVYALLTRPDRIEIVRLGFSSVLEPILSKQTVATTVESSAGHDNSGGEALTCSITRSTMTIIANQYKDNSKYLNATNTDGACAGRDKPRYIGGAGVYSSVAYDWGGFDTVGGYNGYMDPNTYQAGDINTAASESCSRGVDCAGFVSRVWGCHPITTARC
ncbi:MAG: hypothetical protein PHY79_02995 [Anaerolineae bacterium]|nr:hypothetical protein [Anaerolineae bacterium]